MKTITALLNAVIGSQTAQSVIRHACTALGGWLIGKGILGDSVAALLPGISLATIFALAGAFNELNAVGGTWKHFWFSIGRHIASTAGTLLVATNLLTAELASAIVGALISISAAIIGVGDEAKAEQGLS